MRAETRRLATEEAEQSLRCPLSPRLEAAAKSVAEQQGARRPASDVEHLVHIQELLQASGLDQQCEILGKWRGAHRLSHEVERMVNDRVHAALSPSALPRRADAI